jgi:hypothetical protein
MLPLDIGRVAVRGLTFDGILVNAKPDGILPFDRVHSCSVVEREVDIDGAGTRQRVDPGYDFDVRNLEKAVS